jgi:hypothetical protein
VQKVCFHGNFGDENGNYSDVTDCHIIGKLFLLRSIFVTMLLELRSVLVLSSLIEFVSEHYPISLIPLWSKLYSFHSDQEPLSRLSGLSF